MKFSFNFKEDLNESIGIRYSPRMLFIFLFDNIIGFFTLYLAFLLRYDWHIPQNELDHYASLVPFVLICRSISYLYYSFYTRLWEYTSLEDLIQIIKAVMVGSFLLLFSIFIYNRAITIPRSIMVIDMVLLITMLGGSRMAWRLWNEKSKQRSGNEQESGIKVLILGAGSTGALLIKNLKIMSPHYFVGGFIDDDPRKLGTILMGVQVLGGRHKIPELVKKLGIKEVLIALNKISSDSLSEIVDICNKSVVKYKMAASVIDMATNEVHISKVKKIEISDLLGREPVSLDITAIKKMIYQKRVLVTGAGGSIGSELCLQILEYEPATLTMLDRGENYLYELGMALNPQKKNTNTQYLFGSITNKEKMNSVFSQCRPQLVFHAAAHKHVPLMEENVDEAVINNVYGTKITADTSDKFGVERFVMVSTDKVVRPVSV
ncbi:MAG: polysaccharide biosynthesis protein, partial [Nitrospinales bacterium]